VAELGHVEPFLKMFCDWNAIASEKRHHSLLLEVPCGQGGIGGAMGRSVLLLDNLQRWWANHGVKSHSGPLRGIVDGLSAKRELGYLSPLLELVHVWYLKWREVEHPDDLRKSADPLQTDNDRQRVEQRKMMTEACRVVLCLPSRPHREVLRAFVSYLWSCVGGNNHKIQSWVLDRFPC
jgi:hypothetical protein